MLLFTFHRIAQHHQKAGPPQGIYKYRNEYSDWIKIYCRGCDTMNLIPFQLWEGVRSWSSLSAGRRHFSSARKKETLMHKINSKWYCWMYGPRILQKKSPDHLFQVIRWSGAVLTLCSPKKLLFLQKSLFLDGALTQIYNLFMKKTQTSPLSIATAIL